MCLVLSCVNKRPCRRPDGFAHFLARLTGYNRIIFSLLCSQLCGLEPDEQRGDHHERGEGGAGATGDSVRHGVLPASRRVRVVRMEECAEGIAVCGLSFCVALLYILPPRFRYSVRPSVSGKNTNSYRCVSTTVL